MKSLNTGRETDVLMNTEFRGVEAADDIGLCASMLFRGFENTVETGRLRGALPGPVVLGERSSVAKVAMRSCTKIRICSMSGVRRSQSHWMTDQAR